MCLCVYGMLYIQDHDKPVLKHLIDVRLVVQPDNPAVSIPLYMYK